MAIQGHLTHSVNCWKKRDGRLHNWELSFTLLR